MIAAVETASGEGVAHLPRFDAATHKSYCEWRERRKAMDRFHAGIPDLAAWETLKGFLSSFQAISLSHRSIIFEKTKANSFIVFYKDDMWEFSWDTPLARYVCFHPPLGHEFPPDDVILSRLLWLRDDEERFRWYANFQEHPSARAYHLLFKYEKTALDLLRSIWHAQNTFFSDPPQSETEFNRWRRLIHVYDTKPTMLWILARRYLDHMDETDRDWLVRNDVFTRALEQEARLAG